jgi:molybdopterin molybdotransferase
VIGFDEALALVESCASALPPESVRLEDAAGRVLAEDVVADADLPPFETTAMDGWAVRRRDAAEGAVLRAVGAIGAGAVPERALGEGEAVKVMTGAPLPEGCDAVVPVEEAEEEGDRVRIAAAPRPRAHVRSRGEVIAKGETLLKPGRRLTPADLAVAAAAGRAALPVASRARAAVLVTGDEVVAPDAPPAPARIRNTNGPLLLGALRRAGCETVDLGVAPDRAPELTAALRGALRPGVDLLLTTGGVSAGDYDLLPGLLRRLGADLVFHKVALRPAKPLLFARLGRTLVFGLPGNPVSSAVAYDLFVRTALRKLAGLSPAIPETISVQLTAPLKNKGPRLALLPARVMNDAGRLLAQPLATKGSHDLLTHARADALLRIPPGAALEAGACVAAYAASAETTLG